MKSAVEFLLEELKELGALHIDGLHWSDQDDVKKSINQAKEMHKEQIIYAHVAGHNAPSSTIKNWDAEKYYNETFKQQ
jgi:hypothetical protein